jgi:hypothetical protein
MNESGESLGVADVVMRCIAAAAFLLAGLLYLVVPIAGANCGADDGPVGVCLNGAQLASGRAGVELEGILMLDAAEFEQAVVDTLAIPGWLGTLAVIALLAMAAGGVASLLRDEMVRAVVRLAAVAVSASLMIAVEVATMNAMTEGVSTMTSMFSYDGLTSVDEVVSTDLGFWLSLLVLAGIAVVNLGVVAQGARDHVGLDRLSKNWNDPD